MEEGQNQSSRWKCGQTVGKKDGAGEARSQQRTRHHLNRLKVRKMNREELNLTLLKFIWFYYEVGCRNASLI